MTGLAILKNAGKAYVAEVVLAAAHGIAELIAGPTRKSPGNQAFFAKAVRLGRIVVGLGTGMDTVDQHLEIDGFLELAIGRVVDRRRPTAGIGGVGIVTDDAQRRLVIPIAAVLA